MPHAAMSHVPERMFPSDLSLCPSSPPGRLQTVVYRSTGERQLQVKLRSVKAAQDGDLFSLYSEEGAEKNGLPPVALATSHPPSSMRHQLVRCYRNERLNGWCCCMLLQKHFKWLTRRYWKRTIALVLGPYETRNYRITLGERWI